MHSSTDPKGGPGTALHDLPLVVDAVRGWVNRPNRIADSSAGAPFTCFRADNALGSARSQAHFANARMRVRHRLSWFLVALGMHGLLLTLFLLPQRAELPLTPPLPIQTQIITEPRVAVAPPPLKPVSLSRPHIQIVIPVPLLSIPEVSTVSASAQLSPSAAAAVTMPSNAPAAPPVPVSPPKFDAAYLHNPAPDYPLQARRRHMQGTVMLRVEVSAEGGALQVLIEHSSGWPALDDAALGAVRHWRFEPARQGHDAVAAWVLVPVEFHLRT